MSFRNLLEGDCGGQNPLMKLGSHFTQDQAYRQEQVHPLSQEFSQADLLVHEFLEDNLSQNVQTFRMDELFREMRDIESTTPRSINQAPNVAQLASEETGSLWSEQFLNHEKHQQIPPFGNEETMVPIYEPSILAPPPEIAKNEKLEPVQASLNDLGDSWSLGFEKMKTFDDSQFGLGKDWVENFLKSKDDEIALIKPVLEKEDENASSSKFIKFMQSGKEEDKEKDESEKWSEEFLSRPLNENQLDEIWQNESEKSGLTDDATTYTDQFWDKYQKEWEKIKGGSAAWDEEFAESSSLMWSADPIKEYTFETENPMKELENPFEEGLRKLEENDLPSAVLCFEAAAQAEPDNPLVWQYLGITQAENEQDPYAIAALKKCITLQPDNQSALMSLAISYTNENYQVQACQILRNWLHYNPKYSVLVKEPSSTTFNQISSLLSPNIYNEVRDLFIQAANKNPTGEIDVDVQCGLGVLFNLSNEYDKAVDCFKAALAARPKDFRMWNRLGATLANGNRSEEAVDAYYNSLHLSPGFIRARYNLGITCVNLGANREAAEHLLTALNQQAKSRTSRGEVGTMSESIWSTLKLVINLLGKSDLMPYLQNRDVAALSKEFNVK